jgi:hypothetical protein
MKQIFTVYVTSKLIYMPLFSDLTDMYSIHHPQIFITLTFYTKFDHLSYLKIDKVIKKSNIYLNYIM